MTRQEFLAELRSRLQGLPEAEIANAIRFYENYLDNAGIQNEPKVLQDLGSPAIVAAKILAERSNAQNLSPIARPRRKSGMKWVGVLLVFIALGGFLSYARNDFQMFRTQRFNQWYNPSSMVSEERTSMPENMSFVSETDIEPFDSIEIKAVAEEIILIPSTNYGIELSYDNEHPITYRYSNGKLRISSDDSDRNFSFGFNFNRSGYIRVFYPQNVSIESIDIKSVSSIIQASDINAAKCKFLTTSGDIALNSIQTEDLKAATTSGNITLNNMTIDNSDNNCDLASVSGRISANNLKSDGVKAITTSGDVILEGDMTGENKIASVSGQVKVTVKRNPSEYGYDIATVSGTIRIGDSISTKRYQANRDFDNEFDIKTTSGDVEIIE